MKARDEYTRSWADHYTMCEEIDRLRDEVAYLKRLAGEALRKVYAGDVGAVLTSYYTGTVNDLLPRAGMPQHALDELEVDRLNDQRRRRKWDMP